jgi:hypothetical protein
MLAPTRTMGADSRYVKAPVNFIARDREQYLNNPGVPHLEMREKLAEIAPSVFDFSEVVIAVEKVLGAHRRLTHLQSLDPDIRSKLLLLANELKMSAVYAIMAAKELKIGRKLTATELAALAVVLDIDVPSMDTRVLVDKWLKIRKECLSTEELLRSLPRFKLGHQLP